MDCKTKCDIKRNCCSTDLSLFARHEVYPFSCSFWSTGTFLLVEEITETCYQDSSPGYKFLSFHYVSQENSRKYMSFQTFRTNHENYEKPGKGSLPQARLHSVQYQIRKAKWGNVPHLPVCCKSRFRKRWLPNGPCRFHACLPPMPNSRIRSAVQPNSTTTGLKPYTISCVWLFDVLK